MKVIKNFILVIFSIFMLGLAIAVIFSSLDIFNINNSINEIIDILFVNKLTAVSVSFVVTILALVGIFTSSEKEENMKSGLALKNESGTVYITKDTFESIVLNVSSSFATLKNIKVSVNISEEGAIVNIYSYILPDTVVPTLTAKLQESIKDAILKQTTVNLKEVNVKVKGVYNQVEKKV